MPQQQLQGWEQTGGSGDVLSTPTCVPFWGLRGPQPPDYPSLPPRQLSHPGSKHSPMSFIGLWQQVQRRVWVGL